KNYRLFLLGATAQSAQRAVDRLQQEHPGLMIAGQYSPPFNRLLEMDHDEIKRRILEARPDLLFVSFGCPKQEKWVAMHYRQLGVPVTIGVGATIDFLGGQVKRAPLWMQRSGTEWIFRLCQEPRRLFRRYITDLWVFNLSFLPQWWALRSSSGHRTFQTKNPQFADPVHWVTNRPWQHARLPERFDLAAALEHEALAQELIHKGHDCVLELSHTVFIARPGVGGLIRLHKSLRTMNRRFILLSPTPAVRRALRLMRVEEFFHTASNEAAAQRLLQEISGEHSNEPGATTRMIGSL